MATRDDVDRALEHVHRGSDLAFFFDQLTSADWLEPLWDKGLLSEPPEAQAQGDYVRYPIWPAARYLARVAEQAPNKVADIIEAMSETANTRVHEDLVAATLSMPPAIASRLVPRIESWLQLDSHPLLLPERVTELILLFAQSGAGVEALRLARALLAVEGEPAGRSLSRIRPRLPEYEFEEAVVRIWQPLTEIEDITALSMFVDLLDGALAAKAGVTENESFDDGSTYWRGELADGRNQGGRFDEAANALLDAVLGAGESLSAAGRLEEVLGVLSQAKALVFERVALHLLSQYAETVPKELVKRQLVRRRRLANHSLEREYLAALRHCRGLLAASQVQQLAGWIKKGPTSTRRVRERFGDEWAGFVAVWQARRLAALGDALPEADQQWRDELLDMVDPTDLTPAPSSGVTTWVGPTSPKEMTELANEGVEEVVEYLTTWEPTGDWAAPSREGLGRILSAVVAQRARDFSASARLFIGVEPVYVRSLLSGLREAIKGPVSIVWQPVLELCEWVVERPTGTLHEAWQREDRDPGWGWAWAELARLLQAALVEGPSGIPRSHASRVRDVLLRLLQHPNPTPEDEERYGGPNMDPSTLSLNTTRGEALHALIQYTWWRKRVSGAERLELLVRRALDERVDPDAEPSLAVHSAFGRWFGVLHWVDPDWTEAVTSTIFSVEEARRQYWLAAWSSFVVFDQPTTTAHRLLHRHYEVAIDRLRDSESHLYFRAGRSAGEALAGHILAYYLWGLESLAEQGLLSRFFSAPGQASAHLMAQAGRLLREHSDELSADQVSLLQRLWLSRRRTAEMQGVNPELQLELSKFGWWSGSPRLDPEWWLGELHWVVRHAKALDPAFLALEVLPDVAARSPAIAVEVVAGMVRLPDEPWLVPGHLDAVRSVVETAMASDDGHAVESATRLVHDLGARELGDLSGLLRSSSHRSE